MAVSWNSTTAAYLLRRAGFGPTAAEVAEFTGLGREAAVSRLVDYESVDNAALEAGLATLRSRFRAAVPAPQDYQLLFLLYDEFVFRMVFTARPLEEKMTLFWHGHFATSYNKVNFAEMLRQQWERLRSRAVGDFRETLVAMSGDEAMLIWLDNYISNKTNPNENYGRELLELFALGIGNYTETDVNEIARCFTGWTIAADEHAPGGYRTIFVDGIHDAGAKTVLGASIPAGQTVQADGAAVCSIVADHPACARFLATKLWAFFGTGEIPASVLASMTAAYAANGHSIREMLRAMFLADEFYARTASDSQIKSPAELVAGTLRTLGVDMARFTSDQLLMPTLYTMIDTGQRTGQTLFLPPSVKGWDGGRKWVNTSTLLARHNFGALVATNRYLNYSNPAALVAASGTTSAEGIVDYLLTLLGPLDVGSVARERFVDYMKADANGDPGEFTVTPDTVDTKVRGLLDLLLSTPEYQTNARGLDPDLPVPVLVAPAFKKSKLLLADAGSQIAAGARLRVTADAFEGTVTFPLARTKSGTKWVVGKRAVGSPGGATFESLVGPGVPVTLVVENPDGAQSRPTPFTR